MKLLVASIAILPALFGLLAHVYRETDSLVITFLVLWLVFSLVGLVWGFFLSRRDRSLGRQCIVFVLVQFLAFCYLFAVIDSRAKTSGASAVYFYRV